VLDLPTPAFPERAVEELAVVRVEEWPTQPTRWVPVEEAEDLAVVAVVEPVVAVTAAEAVVDLAEEEEEEEQVLQVLEVLGVTSEGMVPMELQLLLEAVGPASGEPFLSVILRR
jgi:hypothetical protein